MTKLYLAGKMRGIPYYNFPAFDEWAGRLRHAGYTVISPAELDREAGNVVDDLPEDHNWDEAPEGFDWDACIERDNKAIKECDQVVLIPGWETSSGAWYEIFFAWYLGKAVRLLDDGRNLLVLLDPQSVRKAAARAFTPLEVSAGSAGCCEDEDVLEEALRITGKDRNAQYGDPNQDFKRTAGMWSAYLEHDVAPEDVAWMMVMLKASRNRHQKKRDNYVDAAGYVRCGARCAGFVDGM